VIPVAPGRLEKLRANPWAVLVTVSLGFFMTLLDTAIVNVAIPALTTGLGASLNEVLWVLNGYTLVFAVLLLVSGRLGDMYGQRRVFVLSLAVFVLASLACGIAQNPEQLIGARIVQGVGAAAMMPQTLALVTAVFPEERRGAAFGAWSAVAGLAAVLAPTVGGALVTYASWRWVFLLNLPIGVVAFVMALLVVPEPRRHERQSLDPLGVLLSTLALTAVTYGLIEGQRYDWGRIRGFVGIPLVLAVGAALFAVFLFVQRARQDRQPLIPFVLFRDRDFAVMTFVTAAIVFGSTGLLLPLMIYLQSVLGLSAVTTGLTLVPMTVVILLLAPLGGTLADRVGGKYLLFGGLVVMAGGLLIMDLAVQVDSGRWALLPGLLVAGAGTGMVFAPMNAVAMRRVPPELSGAAAGIISTSRQLGITVGTAGIGALLQNRLSGALADEAVRRSASLPPGLREEFVHRFGSSAADLRVGVGETGASTPGGADGARMRELADEVFTHAFVSALRPTLLLPVAVVLAGALGTLLLRGRKQDSPAPEDAGSDTARTTAS